MKPQEYRFGIRLVPLQASLDTAPGELAARQWLSMRP